MCIKLVERNSDFISNIFSPRDGNLECIEEPNYHESDDRVASNKQTDRIFLFYLAEFKFYDRFISPS